MIRLLSFLLGLLFLAALGLGVLLLTALESAPLVQRDATISPAAVEQARDLLRANDPRQLRPGEQRTVQIPAALIDEGINYAATRFLHGRGGLVPQQDGAEMRLSLGVPAVPTARYLNLRASVPAAAQEPAAPAVSIGELTMPAAVVQGALTLGLRVLGMESSLQLPEGVIGSVAFDPGRRALLVRYTWDPAVIAKLRAVAFQPGDLVHIEAAQKTLVGLLERSKPGGQLSLAKVVGPLLATAGDSPEQARAALLVLAANLSGRQLTAIIPEAASWPRPQKVNFTLGGRHDSAQHFAVSAALAAWAGEPAAAAVGIFKELDDSRGGSGFSFADLAADEAGTRFGQRAVADPQGLKRVLAGGGKDADLLPSLKGLPENLQEDEFRRRYGGPGEPAYQQVVTEIERRLAAMPLYR